MRELFLKKPKSIDYLYMYYDDEETFKQNVQVYRQVVEQIEGPEL